MKKFMLWNNKFRKYFWNKVRLVHNLEHKYYSHSKYMKIFKKYNLKSKIIIKYKHKKMKIQMYSNRIKL